MALLARNALLRSLQTRLYCTGSKPFSRPRSRPLSGEFRPRSSASSGEYRPRSKASRVIEVPRFEPEPTRTTAPTGILENRGFTIMDFLKTIGNGLDAHHDKLKTLCLSLRDVLVLKTEALKKLGLNVRDRKLILRYAHRYRLGTWKPRKFKAVVEQTKNTKKP